MSELRYKICIKCNNDKLLSEFHIDHIRPMCTFCKTEYPSIVNALSNLISLWAINTEINGVFYEGNLNRKIINNYE